MKIRRPKYVHVYRDRHGKHRIYFNKPGVPKVPLPGPINSPEFVEAYQEALKGLREKRDGAGVSHTMPGTVNDLIVKYYGSPEFLNLSPTSQRVYRRQLEKFRESRGDRPVRTLERAHLKAILAQMQNRPSAANNLLKRLKVLMAFAVDIAMIKANPTLGLKGFKVKSEGFHTWTEDEIAAYEARHSIGSKARLAMALMLYTGQRRSDVVKMGWQHVKSDMISVRQQKTGALLEIPLHPSLSAILERTPKDNLTFLMTEQGRPFTGNGFGNWMRDRCDEAGLSSCSSHGLRKAMAARLSEAGCTTKEIMSITGHETEAEAIRYAKKASQKKLAAQAMKALIRTEARTETANPCDAVSKKEGANN